MMATVAASAMETHPDTDDSVLAENSLGEAREKDREAIERATAAFERFLDATALYFAHRLDDQAKPLALRSGAVNAFRDLMFEIRDIAL
jgi:hypothetical protein